MFKSIEESEAVLCPVSISILLKQLQSIHRNVVSMYLARAEQESKGRRRLNPLDYLALSANPRQLLAHKHIDDPCAA